MARSETRFEIGSVVATPSALALLADCGQSPMEFVTRHQQGDWGSLSAEDRKLNEQAIESNERLISAYLTDSADRIWVITEADRSSTTILLPEEY